MVVSHFDHHYTKGNLLISASGNIKHEQLIKLAEKYIKKETVSAVIDRQYECEVVGSGTSLYCKGTEQVD